MRLTCLAVEGVESDAGEALRGSKKSIRDGGGLTCHCVPLVAFPFHDQSHLFSRVLFSIVSSFSCRYHSGSYLQTPPF